MYRLTSYYTQIQYTTSTSPFTCQGAQGDCIVTITSVFGYQLIEQFGNLRLTYIRSLNQMEKNWQPYIYIYIY